MASAWAATDARKKERDRQTEKKTYLHDLLVDACLEHHITYNLSPVPCRVRDVHSLIQAQACMSIVEAMIDETLTNVGRGGVTLSRCNHPLSHPSTPPPPNTSKSLAGHAAQAVEPPSASSPPPLTSTRRRASLLGNVQWGLSGGECLVAVPGRAGKGKRFQIPV